MPSHVVSLRVNEVRRRNGGLPQASSELFEAYRAVRLFDEHAQVCAAVVVDRAQLAHLNGQHFGARCRIAALEGSVAIGLEVPRIVDILVDVGTDGQLTDAKLVCMSAPHVECQIGSLVRAQIDIPLDGHALPCGLIYWCMIG